MRMTNLVKTGFLSIVGYFLLVHTISILAATGDENWDSRFGVPGVGGISFSTINAIAGSGTNIYVGGSFTQIGGIVASNIARWDGQKFYPLGNGIDAPRVSFYRAMVNAIAVSGTNVFAAGWFTKAGNVAATNIARWDGASWQALGGGVGFYNTNIFFVSDANALAFIGNDLFVGGGFTNAGTVAANNIARWDGAVWRSLTNSVPYDDAGTPAIATGNGVSGNIGALLARGTNLYAGGHFNALSDVIYHGNEVFESVHATNVGVWNGTKWNKLSGGAGSYPSGPGVLSLAFQGSDLIIGGEFTNANGVAASRIARWNGSVWSAIGAGFNGNVNSLGLIDTNLYATGAFSSNGPAVVSRIAKWDGTNWKPLGSGLDTNSSAYGQVLFTSTNSTDLLVGGYFNSAGGRTASGFAIWHSVLSGPLSLQISRSALTSSINLALPAGQTGITLESATKIPAVATDWTAIATTNGQTSVNLTIGSSNQFFRLRKP